MKSFTDLEQSKKLAEILPIESADMYYPNRIDIKYQGALPIEYKHGNPLLSQEIAAWSLAALLEVIYYPVLIQEYDGKWSCIEFQEGEEVGGCETPIDACYEMILKLNEQKLL